MKQVHSSDPVTCALSFVYRHSLAVLAAKSSRGIGVVPCPVRTSWLGGEPCPFAIVSVKARRTSPYSLGTPAAVIALIHVSRSTSRYEILRPTSVEMSLAAFSNVNALGPVGA